MTLLMRICDFGCGGYVGLLGRAEGAGDVAALGDLLVAAALHAPALVRTRLQAAVEAARLWHEAKQYRAEAKAAADVGLLLRQAATAAGAPAARGGRTTPSRTRASGRGPSASGRVSPVAPYTPPGPDRPGPSRSR
ncbi:hypothetical protein J7F03_40595 [Streptomyces sp. ISL-43]|uniref:hypothetical protein n=1 Tax=Streptomyces sp. ISL-43 TaxID=2819183 RepID=UPI001BE80C72|nr:hypothetical protein [Streptomyces sp. ISL-43]MBT2453204.1 hypothetical protein [Streptomyces sp. ISL-43]